MASTSHPRFPSGRRPRPIVLAVALAATLPVAPGVLAQETESPISPAGRVRLELAPSFTAWDHRFGPEGREPLGTDLLADDAVGLIPGVVDLQTALREVLEDPSYQTVLGSTAARVSADQTRIPVRLDVGVFDWLTVGVTVPFVRSRTELSFLYDGSDANLGVNPALTNQADVLAFFEALDGARAAAADAASDACGIDPASAECRAARTAQDGVASFMTGLAGAYGASPLFPTAASGAGEALETRMGSVNASLEEAGLSPVQRPLPLPQTALATAEELDAFLESAGAGLRLPAFAHRSSLWALGDVEVHAAVRLMEGSVRSSDDPDLPPRARWQIGAGGLVRLGTGSPPNPNVPFAQGTGDGQTDVEGRVFANMLVGRLGLWADARYGVQMSTVLPRRIGPSDLVMIPYRNLADVEWTPGNYVSLELAPRYHLSESLAFTLGYRLHTRAEDEYRRVSPVEEVPDTGPIPTGAVYTDAALLSEETEQTVHQLGVGIVFSTLEMWREGRAPVPLEARFTFRDAISGSGGRTPDTFRTGIAVRLYHRFWGN